MNHAASAIQPSQRAATLHRAFCLAASGGTSWWSLSCIPATSRLVSSRHFCTGRYFRPVEWGNCWDVTEVAQWTNCLRPVLPMSFTSRSSPLLHPPPGCTTKTDTTPPLPLTQTLIQNILSARLSTFRPFHPSLDFRSFSPSSRASSLLPP